MLFKMISYKELLKLKESDSDEHWFRGIDDKDYKHIIKHKKIKPSLVPIPYDNQVMQHLGYDSDTAETLQHDIHDENHANVTKDKENAAGYNKHILWFHKKHIANDYGGGYGTVNVDKIDAKEFGKTWGIHKANDK